MLSENIRNTRKTKGLSQDELAIQLNVVRQTVSKWERGLSVPDSEMLVALSDILEVPVSTLLGETIQETKPDPIQVISEKLEVINLQLAKRQASHRKMVHRLFIILTVLLVVTFILLLMFDSAYLTWYDQGPEWSVVATFFHGFEWIMVRIFPFALIGLIVGIILTRKKSQ